MIQCVPGCCGKSFDLCSNQFYYVLLLMSLLLLALHVWLLLSLYCSSCKFVKELFCENSPKGVIVFPFGFNLLCKKIWNAQYVLVKKGNMQDMMFQHVCNIWSLLAGQCCSCLERDFLIIVVLSFIY